MTCNLIAKNRQHAEITSSKVNLNSLSKNDQPELHLVTNNLFAKYQTVNSKTSVFLVLK